MLQTLIGGNVELTSIEIGPLLFRSSWGYLIIKNVARGIDAATVMEQLYHEPTCCNEE